jgi:hypothetical protein
MDDSSKGIRTEFREAELSEILHKPPRVLLGVTLDAEKALADLEIDTVFDLATSAVFGAAVTLVGGGSDLRSAVARHGEPASDIVRESVTAGKPLAELQFLPITALQGVPVSKAKAIGAALDAATVRDFALYPPYRVAVDVLQHLYFPESDPLFDPERPADLVPSTGEYPTERVQYQTVLMDAAEDAVANLVDVASDDFAPIDLAALAGGDAGFTKVAFGALLTYTQSWFSQGVTLGQLLHSVALAPGESTRIAVVDWTRRSRAGETEVVSEEDELANETAHNRAISEVTNAVATEAQSGFSHSSTTNTSTEVGVSHAVDVSAPLGGALGGVNVSEGQTFSNATSSGTADSYSSSFGQRSVGTTMGQNIADRTHQNAHSSRTRRASVVKEVAQSEHENVSTRVIANYNHMHALTVQYYEVVQVHRVDLTLAKADRVVFIPVKLLAFADERLIRRFRGVLARAALTFAVREAFGNLDVIEVKLDSKQRFTALGGSVTEFISTARPGRSSDGQAFRSLETMVSDAVAKEVARGRATTRGATVDAATKDEATSTDNEADGGGQRSRMSRAAVLTSAAQKANEELWDAAQAARVSNLLGQAVLRAESTSLYLPTDVIIERAYVDAGGTVVTAVFTLQSGAVDTAVHQDDPIGLSDVTRIDLRGASPEGDVEAKLVLTLNRNGVRFPVELPEVTIPQGRRTDTPLVTVRSGAVDVNLAKHLADNRLYYSQAVLRSLDAAQLALLLSGLSITVDTLGPDNQPTTKTVLVAQVIDPIPIRYVGNYLAFRMSVESDFDVRWKEWLADHGVEVGKLYKQDIVPLGTGGVFAEAVLGRSNAAEKLDITRFWDWQDSPIPLQPTEIAAIQTGSRATPEDLTPGQLSNPIINITSPTSLPDPAGTAAALQAVQNGNMFRDMSGLQATIGLVQAGLAQTMAGASAAGQQAGENMNNLLKATTERQRVGAEMITDLARTAASVYTGGAIPAGGGMSGGGRGGGATGGSSQQGAKINYFDKTATAPSRGPAASGAATGGAPAPVGGSSGGGQPSAPSAVTYSQNPAARETVGGDIPSFPDMVGELVDKAGMGGSAMPEPDGGAPLWARRAWPILDQDAVLSRIEELRLNPDRFDCATAGLCPAGFFLHNVAAAKTAEFAEFAKSLYASGLAFLGSRKVSPSTSVRTIDYGELAVTRQWPPPPQADWMLMVGLRDSGSWLTGTEGLAPEDVVALASKEYAEFYQSTGWYSSVEFSADKSQAAIKALPGGEDGYDVTIWYRTRSVFAPVLGPVTMFKLATPVGFLDEVLFGFWAQATGHNVNFTQKIPDFEASYLGATVAELA